MQTSGKRSASEFADIVMKHTDKEGYIPMDKALSVLVEARGGEEVNKMVVENEGTQGRELDIISPDFIEDGKVNARKALTAWLFLFPLTTEEKMQWAFKLTATSGDKYINRECVIVLFGMAYCLL